jgi:microcystin-dependent protein
VGDPTTTNIGLAVPLRGSDVGTWDVPINNDMTAIDGLFGGSATISLSSATTIALTTSGASLTPGAGPNQSSNFLLKFTGVLTGNSTIQFSVPGKYVVHNKCTVGTSYVKLAPASGTGNAIGAPDGRKCTVSFDGTDMDYVEEPEVASFLDLCVSTTPAWMNACTVAPYLLANGAIYSTATFPALSARLGSTYGGNGITTFGVPDHQNRAFIPMDFGGNNRITVAGAGIDGTVFGASGGSQNIQSHTHAATVTDPGHTHTTNGTTTVRVLTSAPSGIAGGADTQVTNLSIDAATTRITITNATTGAGSSGNIPPGIVGGMRFIKT